MSTFDRTAPPSPAGPAGIALLCDVEGRILEVVGDELGLADRFPAGYLFHSCLASGSFAKGLSFLQEIRTHQAVFEWELQVAAETGRVPTLSFDGCLVDGGLLVLGAASSQELLGFLDDLMGLHNEQVNLSRQALKELSLQESTAGRFQHDLYNDLTRLNNELANAHRELAKKNYELARLHPLQHQGCDLAAHPLRSATREILSCSDLLLAKAAPRLDAEQLEALELIRKKSESMLLWIDDFLDLS